MADFIVESRMWLPKPRAEVFAFFADPVNVPFVMPPSLRVRLGPLPPAMAAGAVFDLRLVWLGIPLRWRAFVREYDPPARFLDVQVRGPYARWEHRHLFLVDGEGTRVEERVVYRLPFGPLGRLAHTVLVGRQLATLWAYRRQRIGHVLGPVLDAAP
ncbi:MAG TPA: SRPBCC family protein [Methylomirabilota bacterium]|nr:SRPBCC family protein [Methylomirabilota bacterium]